MVEAMAGPRLSRHVEEVEELVVFVERGDDDHLDLAVFGHLVATVNLPVIARRPHRPADHLAEELVVVVPSRSTAWPSGGRRRW